MTLEKNLISLIGADAINSVLKRLPVQNESLYIAFHKHQATAIVYDTSDRIYKADYQDGRGFVASRYKSINTLVNDLTNANYMLVNAKSISLELQLSEAIENSNQTSQIQEIAKQLKGQREAVAVRSQNSEEKTAEYWQGQAEAFDTALHIIRGVTTVA
ncbi:hypothetical protein [Acinetobacter seifertii]|uniref:hypothetical protein n=1 Tax=Acinetobacter seifertii TaxID=1530123 RepID=UPI0019087402|nr:hypothetical protein [Acinetobacter seifertii]MBJ9425195.1 hypothetical protein [Acinetobacter seifertii]